MAKLANAAPFAAGAVLESDRVLNRGTQEGWQADGDV
jgi:phenylalanine-4-hydroxylase